MPEKTAKGWNCTTSEISEITGLSRKSIDDMVAAGLPVVSRGSPGIATVINMYEFIRFRDQRRHKTGPEAQDDATKDRLGALRIEAAELKLAEQRGDLFHLADWQPLVEEVYVAARNTFAGISKSLHDDFSDVPRIGQISRAAHQKITTAISQMIAGLHAVPDAAAARGGRK